MNPTIASLILSLESVISVLAGMVILDEQLSSREILGVCTHVHRHCAGTASGEEKSGLIQRRDDSAMTARICRSTAYG